MSAVKLWIKPNSVRQSRCTCSCTDIYVPGCNTMNGCISFLAIPTADLVERTCPDCKGKRHRQALTIDRQKSGEQWSTIDCPTCRTSAGISTGKVWIVPMEGK